MTKVILNPITKALCILYIAHTYLLKIKCLTGTIQNKTIKAFLCYRFSLDHKTSELSEDKKNFR